MNVGIKSQLGYHMTQVWMPFLAYPLFLVYAWFKVMPLKHLSSLCSTSYWEWWLYGVGAEKKLWLWVVSLWRHPVLYVVRMRDFQRGDNESSLFCSLQKELDIIMCSADTPQWAQQTAATTAQRLPGYAVNTHVLPAGWLSRVCRSDFFFFIILTWDLKEHFKSQKYPQVSLQCEWCK